MIKMNTSISNWVIDPSHTKIGFSVRHFGITETDGFFRNYAGTVNILKEDFSDFNVLLTIQVDSIDTNDPQRDAHLKAEDFFFAEKYPEIKFTSTKVEPTSVENEYRLHGNLTMRDVTKPIVLNVEYGGMEPSDPYGNTRAGYSVKGKINRQDFGLSFNVLSGAGNIAVSNVVKLNIPIQLLKVK
jgi:polyisoprenoid-binding protein YceI